MADLAQRIDDGFKRMDERFEQVDRRFEQVDRRFQDVNRRLDQVDKRFEKTDDRLESLRLEMKGDIKALKSKVDGLTGLVVVVALSAASLVSANAFGAIGSRCRPAGRAQTGAPGRSVRELCL